MTIIMDPSILKRIMSGDTESLPPVGSHVVRIFTSSTFTDTMHERNLLMEQIYPKLRDYCRGKFGLDFQVVDMRWGVRDQATDDHMTSLLCMEEIRNCQRVSNGPNFVAFLGQRHGSRFFPPIIPADEFITLRTYLLDNGRDVSVLDTWFRKDENAISHVYVLQPISSRLPDFLSDNVEKKMQARKDWNVIYGNLQALLCEASQGCADAGLMADQTKQKYFMSVTEEEIEKGIFQASGDTGSQCLCFVRIIEDISDNISHNLAWRYIDMEGNTVDKTAQRQLCRLRDERLIEKMNSGQLFRANVRWSTDGGINPAHHSNYLHNLGSTFHDSIVKLIDKAMGVQTQLSQNEIVVEVLQHLKMAEARCAIFRGREEILGSIQGALLRHDRGLIVIHGVSGCGKTSVLAKSAKLVHSWFPDSKPLSLVRFLGTTPNSSKLGTTLRSICTQIAIAYDHQDMQECPVEFNALVAHFHDCLALASIKRPLVVFLDSLDQLSSTNYAHTVSWLPKTFPAGCHVVVSTLTDLHNILKHLEKKVPGENILKLDLLGDKLGLAIITSWLAENGRTLTSNQLKKVSDAIVSCSLPLYVKLIYDQVNSWRSYESANSLNLSTSVREVINELFDRLERKHGHILVSHALGYITASISGLSETELEDILSIDDVVLTDVFQYHVPPVRRIPSILWLRIRHDISGYLVTREADGAKVVYWYHRQFTEAATARYMASQSESFKQHIHNTLSEFFQGTWHNRKKPFTYTTAQMKKLGLVTPESEEDRHVASQPLYFELGARKRYNLRKLNNLPYHMAKICAEKRHLIKEMCFFNYMWLHSKLVSSGIHSVLSDLDMMNDDHECHKLRTALNLARSTLSQNPDTLALEITGRLIQFAVGKDKSIEDLVQQCFIIGGEHNGLMVKEQCFNAPGGALRYYLEYPNLPAEDLVMFLSAAGSSLCVVNSSNDIIVWDLTNGEIEKEVKCVPEIKHKLNVINVMTDRVVLTGSYQQESNPVVIFDTNQCEIEHVVTLEKIFKGVGFMEDYKVELLHGVVLIVVIGKEMNFFDQETGRLTKDMHIVPTAHCVSSDRKKVLFGDKMNSTLCVVDVESLTIIQKVTTAGKVTRIVESIKDGMVALTCDKESCIFLYEADKDNKAHYGKYIQKGNIQLKQFIKQNNKQVIYVMKISPRGTYIMVYVPGVILLWNMIKNKIHRRFELEDALSNSVNVSLTDIQFSCDERLIFASHLEHLLVWNITKNRLMRNIRVEPSLKVDSFVSTLLVETSKNCSSNVVCTSIRRATQIKVWDWDINEEEPVPMMRLAQSCRYLAVAEKSNICIARSFSARETSVIDLLQGTIRGVLSKDADVARINVTKSGRYAILGEINSENPLRIWDTRSLRPLTPLPLNTLRFCSCVRSDSDKYIATHCETSITQDVAVQIWDLKSSVEVTTIKVKEGGFEQIHFADGDQLLILHQVYNRLESKGRDCLILICDVETGDVLQQLDRIMTSTMHVTPDSKHIVYVRCGTLESDDRLITMEVSKSKGNRILREHSIIPNGRRLCFSNDASIAIDIGARALDMIQGNVICDFKARVFTNRAMWPKITPNGRYAVWINHTEASISVGRIHRDHHQVIGQCYVHASPIALGLYPEDLIIVGVTDGRVLLLNIVDSADDGQYAKKGRQLFIDYQERHIAYGRCQAGELDVAPKRSPMCVLL